MEDEKDIKPKKSKNRLLKKTLKIFSYIIVGIITLNVVLYALLSIPSVQQRLVNFVLAKLKPIVQTEISIDKVRISLFNRINLEGVYIEDQSQDTLVYAQNLDVSFNLWRLLHQEVAINSIELSNAKINVSQDTIGAVYNFQFLIDAFASQDSTQKDESKSALKIRIEDIQIKNTQLAYNVLSDPETPDKFNLSHVLVKNLKANLSVESIDISNLDVDIKSLSFTEHSGFTIIGLKAHILSEGTVFRSDEILLELPKSKLKVNDFKFNLLNSEFSLTANSNLEPRDLIVFMPELNTLDKTITLSSNISGKLPSVNINDLSLKYGDELDVNAKASISDYVDYTTSDIALEINKFNITPQAITQLARIGDPTFALPDIVSSIQYIRLNGTLNGSFENLIINAEAWTNLGSVSLAGRGSASEKFDKFKINANLNTQNFNIVPFVGKESGFGRLTANTRVELTSGKTLDANIKGIVNAVQYKDQTLRNIRFEGRYNPSRASASVDADLFLGKFSADANVIMGKKQEIDFNLNVDSLLINYIYKNPNWSNPKLSLSLNGKLSGNDINNLEGLVVLDSLRLWGDSLNYPIPRMTLESGLKENNSRYITFNSSFVKVNLVGQYDFINLSSEFSNIMHQNLPSFFPEYKKLKTYRNNFDLDIAIMNTEELSRIIELPVNIMKQINIHGVVNTIDRQIKFNADIPHIRFGETSLKNGQISIKSTDSICNAFLSILLPQKDGNLTMNLNLRIEADSIKSLLTVKNDSSNLVIDGKVQASAHFLKEKNGLTSFLSLQSTDVQVGKLNFSVLPASIINKGQQTFISNFGVSLNQKKYFGIDGVVSPFKEDSVKLYFDRAQIGDLLSLFDISNIKAEVNGEISITNTLGDLPEYYTHGLNLADIIIFNDTLGTLYLESEWSDIKGAIKFDATLQKELSKSNINGLFYTTKDSMNLNADIDRLSLKWAQPFMADMMSELSGSISSKLSINGKTDSPIANGWIGFNDIIIQPEFTNVRYSISDTIKVLPDRIGFRDLIIRDSNKNTATASALITHNGFRKFEYVLNLDMNNFLILNTENRTDSLFFGRLATTGNVKIKGSESGAKVEMKIKNDRNSTINITIPTVSEASTFQSVVYINTPQDSNETIIGKPLKRATFPLDLDMDLALTPDLSLAVILNPITGDAMQVRGTGNIKFTYDLAANDMKAFGDYIVSDGSVRIRIQNISTLEFKIREGSKLIFTGDPMSTSFDVTAYRRVRASLTTLDSKLPAGKIPVDCVLRIKGNIQKMDLTYDISLPEATEDIKRRVQAIINTDEDKVRQFAYLIATGSFEPTDRGSGGSSVGGNMWASLASSTLSEGLDALLGNVLGSKWQINTNIAAQDGSFSEMDMTLSFSTKLFDDKLKLNSNVGYRTDQTTENPDNTFIGDFDIEYELSKFISLRAFNRTNERFERTAAMTQGIGITYTKEAKTLRELFRFFGKKSRKENK